MLGRVLAHGFQNHGLGNVLEVAFCGRLPPCSHVEAHGLRQFLAGLVRCGTGRHHVHRGSHAHGQQPHQFILRLRQQRGKQFGAVLRQGFARHLLQFAQRHGGGSFRPVRGHAFQPVLHFEAHAQRQRITAAAVAAFLQDGLHHAMHHGGQRGLRMPGDFDL